MIKHQKASLLLLSLIFALRHTMYHQPLYDGFGKPIICLKLSAFAFNHECVMLKK